MLFAGLAQLFGGNISQIGAAYPQVEPLVADGLAAVDLDLVEKGTALPAGVVRNQDEVAIRELIELESPGADDGTNERGCARIRGDRINRARTRNQKIVASQKSGKVRHGTVTGKDHLRAHGMNRSPRTAITARPGEGGLDRCRCQRRAILKMHARPQPELPATIVVLRRPADGQRRTRCSVCIESREPIEDKPFRQLAVRPPGIALDLNVERAAVMGTRARRRRERDCGDETANCKGP